MASRRDSALPCWRGGECRIRSGDCCVEKEGAGSDSLANVEWLGATCGPKGAHLFSGEG